MNISWIQDKSYLSEVGKAISDKVTPLSVDTQAAIGAFVGSTGELYSTGLEACNCGASNFGYFPCKHMVRLAMELGLIPNDNMASNLELTQMRLYNRKIEDFIKFGSFQDVKKFIDFIQSLDPSLPDYNYFLHLDTIHFLLDTSKKKIKLSKNGKTLLKKYTELFFIRIGNEFYTTGSVNTAFQNDAYTL